MEHQILNTMFAGDTIYLSCVLYVLNTLVWMLLLEHTPSCGGGGWVVDTTDKVSSELLGGGRGQ